MRKALVGLAMVMLLAAGVAPASAGEKFQPFTADYLLFVNGKHSHQWTLVFGCPDDTFQGTGYIREDPGSAEAITGTVDGNSYSFHSDYVGTFNPGYWWEGTFHKDGGTLRKMVTSWEGQTLFGEATLEGVTRYRNLQQLIKDTGTDLSFSCAEPPAKPDKPGKPPKPPK